MLCHDGKKECLKNSRTEQQSVRLMRCWPFRWREWCGEHTIHGWEDLLGIMPNKSVKNYASIYATPEDIDLWTAGITEKPLPGSRFFFKFVYILYIFWRARVCRPLLRLCRPFMIFESPTPCSDLECQGQMSAIIRCSELFKMFTVSGLLRWRPIPMWITRTLYLVKCCKNKDSQVVFVGNSIVQPKL
jgi:hypothetical protein